ESRKRWEDYTKAKEDMLARTHSPEARWWIVEGDDKKRARLNCIAHFLDQIPYQDIPKEPFDLPPRKRAPDYQRSELPEDLQVPAKF
ncbi:MAG: polyphosphate kinase 2, partial [Myxococcota bacterium]